MTTPNTATEAAAQRATDNAVDRIYHLLDETDISANEIRTMKHIIAAEFAPIVARAEAADRLAAALESCQTGLLAIEEELKGKSELWRATVFLLERIEFELAAYRALAAEGRVQG